jgi:hypothetical protein
MQTDVKLTKRVISVNFKTSCPKVDMDDDLSSLMTLHLNIVTRMKEGLEMSQPLGSRCWWIDLKSSLAKTR